MAFPEDVLTADEQVVLHLHPHWKALIRPVLVLVLALAGVFTALAFGLGAVGFWVVAAAGLGLLLWLSVLPWLTWRSTHYLFTDERVVVQRGLINRDRRDIPLHRINDHAMRQRFSERIFGCGTLTIEATDEGGQSVLTDVPDISQVQTRLYELVAAHHDRHSLGDGEMREILADMREGRPLRETPERQAG